MPVAELPAAGVDRDRDFRDRDFRDRDFGPSMLPQPLARPAAAVAPVPFAPAPDQRPRVATEGGWRADQHQFMALLVRSLPELQGYARRLTTHAAEAHDLVQETCRRAIESRYRFTVGSDMRAWLCRILRNLHCDTRRRSARETLIDDQDVRFPTPVLEERPRWALVSDDELALALASLPPQYQRAYVLHAMEGRSYGEIAEALGVPCSTVGTRILRARLLLRAFLVKSIEARRASRCAADLAPLANGPNESAGDSPGESAGELEAEPQGLREDAQNGERGDEQVVVGGAAALFQPRPSAAAR